ncbi:MAG TPA: hypothetical protein VMH04_11270 [Candidatus Solibacter sp.]|nr:hypothetical protein [Candidatus Solibacter sp.]
MRIPSTGETGTQKVVNPKLEKNLWMYAAAAAAAAAGVGILSTTPADAKVVVTQTNTAISPSVAIDLNHDGFVDYNLTKWVAGASVEVFSYLLVCHAGYRRASHQCLSSSSQANAGNLVRTTASGALDLPFGAPIGPGQHFGGTGERVVMGGRHAISTASFHEQTFYGPWAAEGAGVKNRYLGFKFKIGNQFHYGWARVTVTIAANSTISAVLTGYAYETIANKAIHAGVTSDAPQASLEPIAPPVQSQDSDRQASLGMLSLGSQGLAIWRREDS